MQPSPIEALTRVIANRFQVTRRSAGVPLNYVSTTILPPALFLLHAAVCFNDLVEPKDPSGLHPHRAGCPDDVSGKSRASSTSTTCRVPEILSRSQ
jgi:hypothetical protein